MGKADLHIHTSEGDGIDSVESILEHVEHETELDVIAITEHDHLEVALRAQELWARRGYRFDFIPGSEITTLDGHVVALFIETAPPSLRRAEETIEAVHAQGGLCFAPHPMSWLTRSIGPGTMDRLEATGVRFDAMELASGSPPARISHSKARRLNSRRYQLPALGASDAHFRQAIGRGYTSFPGRTAGELRDAISRGETEGVDVRYPGLTSAGLRALLLPIAGLSATPKRLGWRRTAWSFVSRYGRVSPRPGAGR